MWRMCDVSKRWNRHLPAVAHEAAASSLRCAVSAFSWLAAANIPRRKWIAKQFFDLRAVRGEGDRRKARWADKRGDGGDSGSLQQFRLQMDCFSCAMCDCPSPLHSCGLHSRLRVYPRATPLCRRFLPTKALGEYLAVGAYTVARGHSLNEGRYC